MSHRHHVIVPTLLACALAGAEPATAAITVAADALPDSAYLPAEPASLGVDLDQRRLPAVVSTVPAALWRDTGARTIDDLLPYVPGVNLTDNGGWTGDTIAIRGFAAALPYRDGRRSIGSYGQSVRVMPDAIERIEVVKGPAGSEFGTVEPGGTINLISKRPSRAAGGEGHVTIGQEGYRRIGAEATGPIAGDGAVQGLLIAAYEEPPEWRDGRPDDTHRLIIAPSVNWDYSDHGNLLASYERVQRSGPQDRGIIYLEGAWDGGFAPREWSFHQTSSEQEQETDRLTLANQHRFAARTVLRSAVEYQRLHYSLREFRNAESEPGWGPLYEADGRTWTGVRVIPLGWSDWEGTGDAVSGTMELEQGARIGGGEHTIAIGGRGYANDMANRYVSYSVDNTFDILDPVNDQVPEITSYDGTYTDEIDIREIGLTGRWLGEWTPRFRTLVAAQWFHYSYAYTGFDNGVQDFADAYDTSRASVRVAASWDLTGWATVFAGASDGYVPQSGIQRDGSGVDPIHDRAVEAGVKIGDGTVLWTTSVYVTEREDLTVSDPANGPSESFLVNAGSARIIGVESELAGRVGPDLDLRGGLAVQRSELVENPVPEFAGNQFANTPEFQAGVVASYRWTWLGLERLSTALGVRYMGERYGNSGNTITLPDYVLVDASAAWAFGQGTSLTLNATNLFDETYYTGMQDGNGAGADQVMVGDPRIVSLTCRHRF